ncbi:MAG: HEAT repeat domain-containing protein [Crocosphaera sp.]|nr:HEAT repeat domain-containing protein [Crocosphaera sp.]
MIYYRLSLFIIICLSSWGYPSLNDAYARASSSDESISKPQEIAQGVTADPSPASSSSPAASSYDKAMQAGYKATGEKDYQAAKKYFENALKARPNDIYAQQALQNVEFYLAKQGNIALWVGLSVIIMAIAVGLWFYLRRFSPYSQEKFEKELLKPQKIEELPKKPPEEHNIIPESEPQIYTESEVEEPPQTELLNEPVVLEPTVIDSKESPEVVVENPETTTALPIQATTRIPSGDYVEDLLQELRETAPKKRRQAIWKLAQEADSRAMKPLVDLMIDTDSQERSLILEALSQISTRTLKPMNHALTISLQDKNPQVRKNAIRDLTRIYELMSQISQLLCHAIDDSDREVQDTAKWAINQLNAQIPPRLDIITGNNSAEVTVEESYSETME